MFLRLDTKMCVIKCSVIQKIDPGKPNLSHHSHHKWHHKQQNWKLHVMTL